jgi:hypothetical protein
MTEQEFIAAYTTYFQVEKSETAKLRIDMVVKWINQKEYGFQIIFDKIIEFFKPTNLHSYPLITHIKEIISMQIPDITHDSEANLISSEIYNAVCGVGQYQSPGLSDIANEVVNSMGGWEEVCRTFCFDDNVAAIKAQIRGTAKAIFERQKRKESIAIFESNNPNRKAIKNDS